MVFTHYRYVKGGAVHPRLEPPRAPVGRQARRGVRPALHRSASRRLERGVPSPAEPNPAPLPDRGLALLIAFTVSALVIVSLVALGAAVDRWWILLPLMTVDLLVTAVVLVTVVRLLEDPD